MVDFVEIVFCFLPQYKPAEAIKKTASVGLGNLYVWQKMQKTFLKIEPFIVGELLTKIGQKLFTH